MPQTAPTIPPWHRLVGLAFRGFVATVRVLPDPVAYSLADGLVPILVAVTWFGRKKASRKRRGFYHNVRVVYRDRITPSARRRLLWRWARHMTHLGVDVCKMAKIDAGALASRFDLAEIERVRQLHARGQGILGVTGHTGVYEYSSQLLALLQLPVTTIFRPSPIRPVTDVINAIRRSAGQVMVEREGGAREMLRTIRNGGITGILIDVSSKESEVYAPFLGTPAATNNTAGVLHLKTGVPIVLMTTQRVGRRRYKFHVWDVLTDERTGDRDNDLVRIAHRLNEALSCAIRTYPEQWFWDSRRYRSRPKDEVLGPDGLPPQVDAAQAGAPPQ